MSLVLLQNLKVEVSSASDENRYIALIIAKRVSWMFSKNIAMDAKKQDQL